MKSKILMIAGYYILPVLLIFSVFLLFRGHHETGGGFVGGLTAASGLALFTITHGREATKNLLPLSSSAITVLGLALLVISGITGLISGGNFLEATRAGFDIPVLGNPGTTFIFDMGVYLVVIGSVTRIVLSLTEE